MKQAESSCRRTCPGFAPVFCLLWTWGLFAGPVLAEPRIQRIEPLCLVIGQTTEVTVFGDAQKMFQTGIRNHHSMQVMKLKVLLYWHVL